MLNAKFLSANGLSLSWEQAHQDHSNDTPQYEFHVGACWLPFNVALGLSCLIHSMKPSWNSNIGWEVLLKLSWCARSHDRAETFADWGLYSSQIGELWFVIKIEKPWRQLPRISTQSRKRCPNESNDTIPNRSLSGREAPPCHSAIKESHPRLIF